jgi:hypothetical protein
VAFDNPIAVEVVYQEIGANQAQAVAANAETIQGTPCPHAQSESPAEIVVDGDTAADAPAANAATGVAIDGEIVHWIAELGGIEAARSALAELRDHQAVERQAAETLILAANSAFSEGELHALPLGMVLKLRDSLRPNHDYSGRGVPRSRQPVSGAMIEAPMPQ